MPTAGPPRPIPTVRRSGLERTLSCYRNIPDVDRVEVVFGAGEIARLVVYWRPGLLDQPGRITELIITEDT